MKVIVKQDACIGCGACAAICDEVFEINEEGLSEVKNEEVEASVEQAVQDAVDSCPTGAIETK